MKLSEFKGKDAFKVTGKLISCLTELFINPQLKDIVAERKAGWILNFFSTSLEECSETWMKMYLLLNPTETEEDVSLASVIKFAYDFKNDPELMSLFFSQGDQDLKTSSGLPTENTEATGKM